MMVGLVGENVKHSFSKTIHESFQQIDYQLLSLSNDELEQLLSQRNFRGLNITMPYKETVIPYLDEISKQAKKIGAINTIISKEGKLYGENTDYHGLKRLLARHHILVENKVVAVLGTGGSSKMATVLMKDLRAKEIMIISRDKNGYYHYEDLPKLNPDVIIDATPNGMIGFETIDYFDFKDLKNLEVYVDLVYNPLRNKRLQEAEKHDVQAVNGLDMLLYQAVVAHELFYDCKLANDRIEEVRLKLHQELYNIVLIGMPTAGKTHIGYELSKRMNREFIDGDEVIEGQYEMTISEMFKTKGEPFFRHAEEKIYHSLKDRQGMIISTGGGAVFNQNNLKALRNNGLLVFIDRPLEDLMLADDRPLLSDQKALEHLYEERYYGYCDYADIYVKNNSTIDRCVKRIEEAFYEYFSDEWS